MSFLNKIKKGVKHATGQVHKEQKKLFKKPTKLVEASVKHIEKQLRREIEKEYKKKYNHSISHVYDKIVNRFANNKKNMALKSIGYIMRYYRTEILKELKK